MSTVRTGKKTYRYLTLAESYRDEFGRPRQRIVARIGEVAEMTSTGELERIVDALSAQLGRGSSSLTAESAPSFGAMAACDAYFSRLDLNGLFDSVGKRRRSSGLSDAVFAMVGNRLVDPSSKRRCVTDWLGSDAALPDGRSVPSLDRLYRALDAVQTPRTRSRPTVSPSCAISRTSISVSSVTTSPPPTSKVTSGPRSALPRRPSASAVITVAIVPRSSSASSSPPTGSRSHITSSPVIRLIGRRCPA